LLVLKPDHIPKRRAGAPLPASRRGHAFRIECEFRFGGFEQRAQLDNRIKLVWHVFRFPANESSRIGARLASDPRLPETDSWMAPQNKIALAFMAHPDDAEILCAGTLARLQRLGGWEIHIVTACMGDCGSMSEPPERIAKIRLSEATAAAGVIGATYHCLGERDGFLVHDKPTIAAAMELFRAIGPSLVFSHPLRDYMMDHEGAAKLARSASFLACAPNASATPMRPGMRVPHLYYCDPVEAIDPFGRTVDYTTFVDISSVMDVKEKMLAAHASQREWLRAHHGMDEYIEAMKRHAQMRGRERGIKYAETFTQHRGHAYPANDLLADLFAGPA
jgi:LmbE family N-acetylglucosaminyl deacetylase